MEQTETLAGRRPMTKHEDTTNLAGGSPLERGVGRLVDERREDGMPTSPEARYLRRLLARYSGIPQMYWDDGEAQGWQRGVTIDFMRDPVSDIDAKLMALSLARLKTPNVRANQETTR